MGAVATAPLLSARCRLSRLLRFDLRRSGRRQSWGAFNGDFARLQCLRDLANQIDREETVSPIRSVDPDMVRQLEPVFERTAGNSAMQVAIETAGLEQ
jgi:hypothetical protein